MKNDFEEMLLLKSESTIIDFEPTGNPPFRYALKFLCPGMKLDERGRPALQQEHRCLLTLGAHYPSQPPDVTWLSPIFHPNIKLQAVCHSGQWAPSWSLAEFVCELADMVRYVKYNLQSALDSRAVEWAAKNRNMFPLDPRPIRDIARKIVVRPKQATNGNKQQP